MLQLLRTNDFIAQIIGHVYVWKKKYIISHLDLEIKLEKGRETAEHMQMACCKGGARERRMLETYELGKKGTFSFLFTLRIGI